MNLKKQTVEISHTRQMAILQNDKLESACQNQVYLPKFGISTT